MKKYYIEIVWHGSCDGYILQSHWFDTEEQAIEWAKGIDWLGENFDTYLMGAKWEDDTYGDIFIERRLDI